MLGLPLVRVFHRALNFVDGLFGCLLYLAGGLVDFALSAHLIVVGDRTSSLFNATLNFVGFTGHFLSPELRCVASFTQLEN